MTPHNPPYACDYPGPSQLELGEQVIATAQSEEDLDRGGISNVETQVAPGREKERRRKGRGEGERNLTNTWSLINII